MKSIMKTAILLVLALLPVANIVAQSFCGTPSHMPDRLASVSSSAFIAGQPYYVIRVFLHVMRRSNGTGGQTAAEVTAGLNYLVNDYQAQNICISLLGKDEIWNDTYYSFSSFTTDGNGDGKFDNFSPNSHANAIDIYLFANDQLNFGLAAGIPATALVIGGSAFTSYLPSSHVLSHELGHCLGLYHTFHGMCESGSCMELVNGSNSTTCGDFVSDTPADPTKFNMSSSPGCSYVGATCGLSSTDANGQAYSPKTNLIMSYIDPLCMQVHSNGQGTRMRNMIANTPLLQKVVVPNALTLSALTVTGSSVLYDALTSITTSGSVTNIAGANLTFRAQKIIKLEPGFTAKSNSTFRASIDQACSTTDRYNSAREDESEMASNPSPIEVAPERVFPNPISSGYLHFGKTVDRYSLMNNTGTEIQQGTNADRLDVTGLSKGFYLLKLGDDIQKVVIE